jgi:hypothetical protein
VSVALLTALLLQAIAIGLLRHRLGRLWLRRPVTLLVLTSVVYQGVAPVLLAFPSVRAWDYFRLGVRQSFADDATLILSAGMLAFTIAYLLTRPERVSCSAGETDIRVAGKALDWRFLALACAPLAVLTYQGKGLNSTLTIGAGAPLSTSLASTFFAILVVLTAFGFVLSHGPQWFLPVLVAQSLLLAAAGERNPVVVNAITLIVLLCHAGYRPSGRQIKAAAGLTLIAVLALTGARAEKGRSLYNSDTGLSARVTGLASGLTAAGGSSDGPGLIAQTAVRLDGVDFAGAILQSESFGQPRLSAVYVPESLLLAVPSAIWASKLVHALSPVQMEIDDFGLKKINFLPGLAGMYSGFLSPPWLILSLAGLGAVCGRAERWLFRRWTPARMVLLAGAVTVAFYYEQGLPGMLIVLRSAVVVALVVKITGALQGRKDAPRRPRTTASPGLSLARLPGDPQHESAGWSGLSRCPGVDPGKHVRVADDGR